MIEAIVLAAGLATRMGAIKPLIPIGGEPSLAAVLRRIAAAEIAPPTVVLGTASAAAIETAVDLGGCTVIRNDDPESGMGRSLRLGLDATLPAATGVLIFHADMPFLRSETIRAVLRAATEGATIAAPTYRGTRGFPVFFSRSCFSELRDSLSGDAGGRAYIEAHRDHLAAIPVDDPGCVYDIDRPGDLAAWEGGPVCTTGA